MYPSERTMLCNSMQHFNWVITYTNYFEINMSVTTKSIKKETLMSSVVVAGY